MRSFPQKNLIVILKTKDLANGDPDNKGLMGIDPENKGVMQAFCVSSVFLGDCLILRLEKKRTTRSAILFDFQLLYLLYQSEKIQMHSDGKFFVFGMKELAGFFGVRG